MNLYVCPKVSKPLVVLNNKYRSCCCSTHAYAGIYDKMANGIILCSTHVALRVVCMMFVWPAEDPEGMFPGATAVGALGFTWWW